MSDSDSDFELEYDTRQKIRKYTQALLQFHRKQKYFEDEIPRVSLLPWEDRGRFVMEKYEDLLYGLRERPKYEMRTVKYGETDIDEFKVFCDALRIGWKLWPDCWVGLQMMLDRFAENMSKEEISRLDTATLNIIKEIALCKEWPHNPICGPRMVAPQAKCILVRFTQNCEFLDSATLGMVRMMAGLMNPVNFLRPASNNYSNKNICEGIDCFRVETETIKFKICGRCRKATYCSKECQVKSWKALHKASCRRL